MRIKNFSVMLIILFSMVKHALAEEPSTQYQWTDPKTGKLVTRDYPPANLQMRQVERRGHVVILEVIGAHKLSDAVNLATPKSVEASSSDDAIKNCFSAVQGRLKDPYSAVLEGGGPGGFTTEKGAARQQVVISVNAKNGYGGYAGSKSYICVLQMDNVTVSYVK